MKWNKVACDLLSAATGVKKIVALPVAGLIMMVVVSSPAAAGATPVFIAYDEVSFGQVLFVSGNCTMSHVDGSFTFASPDSMCGAAGKGTPGHYLIITEPGKQVRIKVLQRDNEGDGFVYIPAGELISDAETLAITPNIAQDISSGAAGSVRIKLGGQLLILSPTTPSSSFNLIKVDGIEWSILP